MERHTVVTILFGMCFLSTTAISIPLSHIAYISASVTIVVHYLFIQFLVDRVLEHRHQLLWYLSCTVLGFMVGIILVVINYSPQGPSDLMKASLSFLIINGIGLSMTYTALMFYGTSVPDF